VLKAQNRFAVLNRYVGDRLPGTDFKLYTGPGATERVTPGRSDIGNEISAVRCVEDRKRRLG
jgi:hypothetical protein